MNTIINRYEKRIAYYERKAIELGRKTSLISNLRLITAGIGVILGYYIATKPRGYVPWMLLLFTIGFFLYLVIVHKRCLVKNEYITLLKEINHHGAQRLKGQWREFSQRGDEFKEEEHPYASDLDVFGQGSLFQWINGTNTNMGKRKLAQLLTPLKITQGEIEVKQQAIQELAHKGWWRQRLQLEGAFIKEKNDDHGNLFQWSTTPEALYTNYYVKISLRFLPLITISVLALSILTDQITMKIPLVLVFIQLILSIIGIQKRNRALSLVYSYKNRIKTYGKILKHIERTKFKSKYLIELKNKLITTKGKTATAQLKQLERIVDNISNRSNFLFLPINILTLWDYQCMIDLEGWKQQSGSLIENWLTVIGEVEALSSLAVIPHDYPSWTFPSLTNQPSVFIGKSLGHPLLKDQRVFNDISIEGSTKVMLITGSNMSGKSTLLRTVGINLILAYAGAPIYANYLKCSLMDLYTCMRISDNMEKNISSFYAELIRIKKIVEATKEKKKVLFLLDEIFKGTNSQDRHLGAKVLIKQLYNNNGIGLVSTHDLELADMEQESYGLVKNYHFQEYYEKDEIHFDYLLRRGVSRTRNALYLIKLAGVEIEELSEDFSHE